MKPSLQQHTVVSFSALDLSFHLHVREHKRVVWEMLCVFKKLLGISDGWDMKNKETRALWIPGFSVSCRRRGEVWGMLTEPLQWPPWASPGVPVLSEPFQCMVRTEMGLKWSSKHSCQCHPTVTIRNQDALKMYGCISLLSFFFLATGQRISQSFRTGCVLASPVRGGVFFQSHIQMLPCKKYSKHLVKMWPEQWFPPEQRPPCFV